MLRNICSDSHPSSISMHVISPSECFPIATKQLGSMTEECARNPHWHTSRCLHNFSFESLIKNSIHIYLLNKLLLVRSSHIIYCCLPSLFCWSAFRRTRERRTKTELTILQVVQTSRSFILTVLLLGRLAIVSASKNFYDLLVARDRLGSLFFANILNINFFRFSGECE